MGSFQIKRIYEQPTSADGFRVLVDRMWPRGVSKETALLSAWMKGVAPSTELRKWFNHRPERFEEFSQKYVQELYTEANRENLSSLVEWAKQDTVTLIYAAKDEQHNHAVVLKRFLDELRG